MKKLRSIICLLKHPTVNINTENKGQVYVKRHFYLQGEYEREKQRLFMESSVHQYCLIILVLNMCEFIITLGEIDINRAFVWYHAWPG